MVYGERGTGSVAVGCPFEPAQVTDYRVENVLRASELHRQSMAQVPALLLPGGELVTERHHDLADAHFRPRARRPRRSVAAAAAFLRWMAFVSSAIYALLGAGFPRGAGEGSAAQAGVKAGLNARIAHGWGSWKQA